MMPEPRSYYIVDDDEHMIELMSACLEASGHQVQSSTRGVMAISEIVAKKPDVVLIDLVMAELDGLQLCAELRRHPELKHTSMIMVSAREREYWAGKAREAGVDGYVSKPINPATFSVELEALH